MRPIRLAFIFSLSCFLLSQRGSAQVVDAYAGLGTAITSSSGTSIDTFGTGNLYQTPAMGGLFFKYGGTFMFSPHLGVGAESSFRTSQGSYAGLTYRPTFWDINGVYHPLTDNRRIVPEFQGGLGGVNLKFYYGQQFCDSFAGCSTTTSFLESSNHFQVHMSAGVKFYVAKDLFVKPQVDAHWVNNFFQFGSNWVPEYGAVVGWTFGRH